jgi:aminoglycoside phosphotransferase (APT) family kinase protein
LIDWEDCGFGPPLADEIYLTANTIVAGMRAPRIRDPAAREAVAYWQARVSAGLEDSYARAELLEIHRALTEIGSALD